MRKVYFTILGILLAGAVATLVFLIGSNWILIKSFLNPPRESISVLILGKGGMGHSAPDLTDTILFASVSDDKVTLVSLPRDIWVPEIRAKLNSAYYWGGLSLAKETAEKITGQKVNYGLVIDFSGFKNIIDVLGGIEVDVENSFTDEKYPIAGRENDLCDGDKAYKCRYETITFEKGVHVMSGETALKFVRSRNAQGDEGTDIAREARQQLVISAIKNKILSPEILLNPKKLNSLASAVKDSMETDISGEVGAGLLKKLWQGRNSIESFVLPEEFLLNPPISSKYDKQYVFVPESGSWEEVQKWIENLLSQ